MKVSLTTSNMTSFSHAAHRVAPSARTLASVALVLSSVFAANVGAQSINQTTNGTVTYDVAVPNAFTIGQTFIAPVGASALTGFSFWLGDEQNENTPNASALQMRAYLMAWNGARAVGPTLHVSTTREGPTAASQQYQFVTPNIPLTPGATYVAFLSTSGLFSRISPMSARAALWLSDDASSQGTLVFTENGDDLGLLSSQDWDYPENEGFQGQFQATFRGTVVPEPSSALLIASGLIALGGWRAARRRRS